jgi:hypothetical protein
MTRPNQYGIERAGGPGYEPVTVAGVHRLDLAEVILRGRTESLSRIVGGLEALVAERQRLRDEAISAIQRDELLVSNLRLALYRPGVTPSDNPSYLKLRVEQLRLAREYRQAVVDCWRDTALLAKDLVESMERSQDAVRSESLIRGGGR